MDDAPLIPTTKEQLAGATDYRGRPVHRRSSGGWRSALFVVAVEIAGSFAYFGISANLITYLTGPMGLSNAAAAAAVNAWSGTASLMPLLGAFLADAFLGRYRSIILACSLYVLGYGMLALSATLPALRPACSTDEPGSGGGGHQTRMAFFYVSLYLVALAQGADKPCGLAFAADQFDADHPEERASRGSLFNWWFFCMAVGISVAVFLVGYVQENVGWGIGFGVPCIVVLCAFTVFLLGTPTYRLVGAGDDEKVRPFLRLAAGTKENVLRLLPIWATSLAYGLAYAQITTLFNKQGRTLDRRIGMVVELPPAALQALGPVSILVFVPVYDRALVPALRRATGHPSGMTMLQRVGAGMAMSLAAVSVAALVEGRRRRLAVSSHTMMSWAWLVPQYGMMGAADVLAVVGLQELFYDQMPDGLRSLGLALYLSVMGVGGFISGLLISLIDAVTGRNGGDSWFADDLNRAHLDYFYWLLAGISAAELALFLYFARSYVYSDRYSSLQAAGSTTQKQRR